MCLLKFERNHLQPTNLHMYEIDGDSCTCERQRMHNNADEVTSFGVSSPIRLAARQHEFRLLPSQRLPGTRAYASPPPCKPSQ